VGNSGTLLNAEYGRNITQHAAVWRLNLAPTTGVAAHAGVRTHVSFINGHRLHWCAREAREAAAAVTAAATAAGAGAGASRDPRHGPSAQPVPCAACFPYGHNVPVLTNLWEPVHYEDLAYCRAQRPAEQVRLRRPLLACLLACFALSRVNVSRVVYAPSYIHVPLSTLRTSVALCPRGAIEMKKKGHFVQLSPGERHDASG